MIKIDIINIFNTIHLLQNYLFLKTENILLSHGVKKMFR